ncbi:MAG: hypothetical protein IKO72_16270 [Kiritimatiellae bacterium]|nr:hypothetical protein [Kiritimatiellia bacterium]
MKTTRYRVWGLDWRVLIALPVLSVAIGLVNNVRVPEDMRVSWSGARAQSDAKESSVAQRGDWTSNFVAATNAAESAHIPVVVVVTRKGCTLCVRLKQALKGVAVKDWMRKRNWYFVMVEQSECKEAVDLAKTTPNANELVPYVGVYWTREDGTMAMRNFPGRHGLMGVRKEKLLALEWMRAVESSVQGAPGLEGNVTAASIVKAAKLSVSVGAEYLGAAKGTVKMTPDVRFVKEGKAVRLYATPKPGSVLVGWRYPDGRMAYGMNPLAVASHYPEGRYAAVFRRIEDCAAPVLKLPEKDVEWTIWNSEKLALRVNTEAYPVTFSCEGLPRGMELNSPTRGIIVGTPMTTGVWRVSVAARGASDKLPPATGSFTVRVVPNPHLSKDDDDDAESEVGEVE